VVVKTARFYGGEHGSKRRTYERTSWITPSPLQEVGEMTRPEREMSTLHQDFRALKRLAATMRQLAAAEKRTSCEREQIMYGGFYRRGG
jgi:hypothetical protein